jgi:PAS domain S-box-containing protein
LGLTPLLVAFPVLIAVLVLVGGERAETLMLSNLRGDLAGSRNYLEQLRQEAGVRMRQLAASERLMSLVNPKAVNQTALNQALAAAARSGGLDFLLVATADGRVIGSSTGVAPGRHLPDSYVIRQARIGLGNSAYERYTPEQLSAFSPDFPAQARVIPASASATDLGPPTDGLLINAAAHFPLTVNAPDAILVGGILINRNKALIEHMRQIIYPLGTLPGDAEGISAIYLDGLNIAISRQRGMGGRTTGGLARKDVQAAVLGQGQHWLGKLDFDGASFMSGFEAIEDGDGRRIGMIGVSFPAAPYQKAALLLLSIVGGLLALTMMVISILFLRTGQELTRRLQNIGRVMTAVSQGDRMARVGRPKHEDELGALTRHFDHLLDTIAAQNAQQERAQRQIADEASRRRTLFEKVQDGIAVVSPNGYLIEANPRFAQMLGYSPERLVGLHVSQWTVDSPALIEARLKAIDAQTPTFESRHRRSDGSVFPAEVTATLAEWNGQKFVLAMVREITQRKAVEAELEQYRKSLEALVEQRTRELNVRTEQLDAIFALSPDGFVSFDVERRVSFANGAFLRMAGLEGTDLTGMGEDALQELLASKCVPTAPFPGIAPLLATYRQQLQDGISPADSRRQLFELAAPASRVLEVGIRVPEASTSVSQILSCRDVTHETEVDRMKSEFLTTAAHELRTPMASIYGYTELLRLREFEAPRRQQLLDTISRQSQLMSSIINELLDLARIESRRGKDFVIELHCLQDIVAETCNGYKVPTGRKAPMIAPTRQPLYVNVDRQKIQQALLNIISNAYKYSPQGGEVAISLHVDETPGARRVGIEVLDQGMGMTAEQLARVFERFYRADDSGNIPGTGLGMSIVKEIVELHRGEVRLASAPGQGTTVMLWLPLAEGAAPAQ